MCLMHSTINSVHVKLVRHAQRRVLFEKKTRLHLAKNEMMHSILGLSLPALDKFMGHSLTFSGALNVDSFLLKNTFQNAAAHCLVVSQSLGAFQSEQEPA